MDEDEFETVAITCSQPEAAVMRAMFAFYGIPAFAVGRWHASASPVSIVGLQGIAVRVISGARDEALNLLAEVAERPAAVRPYMFGSAYLYRGLMLFAIFLVAAVAPPTRTASVFMLWKRRATSAPIVPYTGEGRGDDQPATAS